MAYTKELIIRQAREAIVKHNLIFIDDIIAYVQCSRGTFYNHDLHKLDELSELLLKNKTEIKTGLKKKWYLNDNATTQIMLYKLCSTPDEHKLLSQKHIDHTTKDEKISFSDDKDEMSMLTQLAENEGLSLEEFLEKEGIDPDLNK